MPFLAIPGLPTPSAPAPMLSWHSARQWWMLRDISDFGQQVDRPEDRVTVGNDIRESAVQLRTTRRKNLRKGGFQILLLLSVSILSISFLIKWISARAILTSAPVARSLISAIPNPIKKNKIKFAKITEQKIKVTE